ncbi:MAG: DUF2232 domain-containing protein [bacterium]|nr:DUF2232 domain-containing protein [bacterium]
MTRPWPGYLPPLVAATATLAICLLFDVVSRAATDSGAVGLAAVVLLPLPLLVSVLWCAVVVAARPHWLVFPALGGWLAAGLVLSSGETVWPLASHAAAGMVAGFALGVRWRLDAALGGIVVMLLPLILWSVQELPVGEQLDMLEAELLPQLESALPEAANPEQRRRALATERERLGSLLDLAGRIYPFVLAAGLLGQALLVLVLGWVSVRIFGWRLPPWRPPPFARWRLPFYLVWLLAAGVGLMITRQPTAAAVGLNLALLAATVLSIQGIAVQFHMTARFLSPLGRVVFWTLAGVFVAPMIMAGGVLLGLADQWLDLRNLDRPPGGPDSAGESK